MTANVTSELREVKEESKSWERLYILVYFGITKHWTGILTSNRPLIAVYTISAWTLDGLFALTIYILIADIKDNLEKC